MILYSILKGYNSISIIKKVVQKMTKQIHKTTVKSNRRCLPKDWMKSLECQKIISPILHHLVSQSKR